MRVLVCGGAGYIGSNMTAMLAAEGHEPTVFDNLSTGHTAAIQGTHLIRGDLGEYHLLVQTLRKYAIEAVMHFAASIEVGESVLTPLKYYRNNLCNTHTLLSAMETAHVERFVLSSTAAVYGMPLEMPVKEDSPTQPINPYGQTKLAAEKMCHYQSRTGRLRYAALRYFNASGAGNNSTLGEDHRPESHLIPLAIQAAMAKRSQLDIYGTDYPTPDGTCIRDYIHVEDLCKAHLLALDRLRTDSEIIYNLGNNKGYSVTDVVETVKRVSGRDFKVVQAERRAGDAPVLTCDHTRAKQQLGWEPEHPELEQIVATAWKWHSEHPNGYPD